MDSSGYWAVQIVGSCEHCDEHLHYITNRQFFLKSEQRLDSQKGLCSVDSVTCYM